MSRSAQIKKLIFCIFLGLLLMPVTSWSQESDIGPSEAKTVLNTLKYIRGLERKKGDVVIAVLYQENDRESEAYARQGAEQIEDQKVILKKMKVRAETATLEKLNKGIMPDILLIPPNFSTAYPKIRVLSKENKLLTLSLGADCARQEACAISIETSGGVDIYLNEKVLSACGYDVDAAFRYMAIRL
ncbi:MAG: hypothetical protein IPH06_08860 [Alphaproteobacteria bacterium]|jgi:hypothetical protein|nr:hypothetical protein [Alphaproteobacteria bacterium]QQS58110.1 MAG: hypothetical protein IPN28_04620 [Alphaproteobacteria bacterium]